MKNHKIIIVSASIFIITLIILITPLILPVFGVVGNTTSFNVSLTVNGGAPTITYVQAISDSPNEASTKVIHFYFNATHPNGAANIPASGAAVAINQSGTILSSSGCTIASTDSALTNEYDCSITIYYYTLPGIWTINASITDQGFTTVSDTTAEYTNGNTYGIEFNSDNVAFNGIPGNAVGASGNPHYVNNTGNMDYSQINLTAFDLQSGSNFIGAGNFTANTTDDALGQQLINNSAVTLLESNISVNAIRNVYLYANIPAGIANGTYDSTSAWVITVS